MPVQRRFSVQVLLALMLVSVGMAVGLALGPSQSELRQKASARRDSVAPSHAPEVARSAAVQAAPQFVRDPTQEARIQALEKRVEELTSRSEVESPSSESPPSRPELAELKRAALQQQQARLDQHQRQSIDPTWSSEATRSFSSDFATLMQGQQFMVRSIDCRTTSCIAKVEWPSYADAAASYQTLLQHSYGMDCTRSLLLPEPEDPNRAYEASFILDCQNLR